MSEKVGSELEQFTSKKFLHILTTRGNPKYNKSKEGLGCTKFLNELW